jgi:23S rRNA (pseudouridine1915-N3)-methyltransferase
MKISLLVIGKTDAAYLRAGIEEYEKRLNFYIPYQMKVLPESKPSKKITENIQKDREADAILAQLKPSDQLLLLDERGIEHTSLDFSAFLARKIEESTKRLTFAIGGPYGFSPRVLARAQAKISLSRMTFSHQMARLIFVEQLYRAMTIWKGEPYHHG